MSKIKVPEGMLKAVYQDKIPCSVRHQEMENYLESALRWLSENPIMPSDAQSCEMYAYVTGHIGGSLLQNRYLCTEWQRRMFLASEPETPISDLLFDNDYRPTITEEINERMEEAYRRGQKAGSK